MTQLIHNLLETGLTLFIIEHIMAVIMNLSHRVIVLDHGEMICGGAPWMPIMGTSRYCSTFQ